jgi:D-galactarolactone cycloisomerase
MLLDQGDPRENGVVTISRANFWHLRLPLETRYGDANGLKEHRTTQVVRLETDEGIVGWGETFGYRVMAGQWPAVSELVLGADPNRINWLVDRIARIDLPLAAAIDIALWDIKGKRAGMALAELFGGRYRKAQPAYASLQNVSEASDVTAAAVAEATRAMELGFTSLKMKIGWHPVAVDIAWTNAVIDALPAGVPLAVDANRAMDLATAKTYVRGLRHPERISWFEEPLANTSLPPHVELRQVIDIPVSGAESMPAAMIEQVVATRAMDIINPDLCGHGGFERLRRLGTLAEAAGIHMVPHVFDGQLARVATLHFLASRPDWAERQAAYPAAPLECDISPNALRDELLNLRLRPDAEGRIPVPTGPGLGVEINEELLRRYAVASQ